LFQTSGYKTSKTPFIQSRVQCPPSVERPTVQVI